MTFDRARNFVVQGCYFVDNSGGRKQTLDEGKPIELPAKSFDNLVSPNNVDEKRIFLMHSVNPSSVRLTGESVARHFQAKDVLLTSVFFRLILSFWPAQGNRVVPSLAYQLVVSPHCPEELKVEILGAYYAEPDIPEQSLQNQFQKLIVRPLLNAIKFLPPTLPIVFLLDSVHDCQIVEIIIYALAKALHELRKGGVNAIAVITTVSYSKILDSVKSHETTTSITQTSSTPVTSPHSLISGARALAFPLLDLKYKLPDVVQRVVEVLTAFLSFASIPFVVYLAVLISGLLIGLGPGAFLLAGTVTFLVGIPMLICVSIAFPIFVYTELARVIWPRSG
ncbi:uncharacterized protein LACBIDRAFT_323301 [Laccaria bicolor S238N-H82]|uniref:Predicted protein n=1 Tax=Laccaria bicolor (strain S238N-H82 / ATCC MYA-4686) TaxID=486041 RepID=B0CZS3_LACBS|nr:uncharacterized protein LACBIDRAFT_323301 [Laccaria bicolor S238N-H82]EDR12667.1 predicted protein [Laccaria bicolor S238N-H82]|eukprot:XP_001876931.1 predicted protein [Laccaria bicolor S238N-H82]